MTEQTFTPTRAAGLARLASFQPQMGRHYANMRNHDLGPNDRSNVSALSPWARCRLLTEQELAEAALNKFALSTAEKFVQEVCWRTYWKGWLQHRPGVWSAYQAAVRRDHEALARNAGLRTAYSEATTGQTGIAVFDAWTRELIETGYLHNHSRMWFSSIWIYTLKLPWALGADFFLQHLMDGDAASNTLSWRWTAGLHTQGKIYLARPDNIAKYAGGRFEAELGADWRAGLDRLAKAAPALEGDANPSPGGLGVADTVPDGSFGLLLTEEDLHPASLLPPGSRVAAIAGASFAAQRSAQGVGQAAEAFVTGALDDALAAAAQTFGAEALRLSTETPFEEAVLAWAQGAGVRTVVTAEPPVGWVKPHLDAFKAALSAQGINLVYLRRPWDEAFWPHARKGFFALKKKIPSVLAELGLPA
ncbi:MAG: FAD-binding domain-containing protein [Pseudomonadota bacterium]